MCSLPDEKFMQDFRSHTSVSQPSMLENMIMDPRHAVPSRHQIDVHSHPQRQQSHSLAFLDPTTQCKKAAGGTVEGHDDGDEEESSGKVLGEKDDNSPTLSPPGEEEVRGSTPSQGRREPTRQMSSASSSSLSKIGGRISKERLITPGTRSRHGAASEQKKSSEGKNYSK